MLTNQMQALNSEGSIVAMTISENLYADPMMKETALRIVDLNKQGRSLVLRGSQIVVLHKFLGWVIENES